MAEKKYIIDNPTLMVEWDWEKNNEIGYAPNNVLIGSGKKVWWKCVLGHSWFESPNGRAKGTGCPYCSGHRLLVGFNDLPSVAPHLLLDWDYENNNKISLIPEQLKANSLKKAHWICHICNTHWQATIGSRAINGRGCPKCGIAKGIAKRTKTIIQSGQSFEEKYPKLSKEWHPSLNGTLNPSDVTPNSNKYAWWLGECGHTWKSKINHRANGSGCPFCANQKVLTGFNDLATKYPHLLSEWNTTHNTDITPQTCLAGGKTAVWWKCDQGHSYKMTIADKLRGFKCPYCQNSKLLIGFNDLASTNPELAKEWHPTKNGSLRPQDVFAGTPKQVWWQCKKGHEWKAPISRRNSGNGCPECNKERHTSLNENIFLFYLQKHFQCESSYRPKFLKGKEIDIFLPTLNIGIEYDGQFHHQNVERDYQKNKLCSSRIELLRIREPNCPILEDGLSKNFVLSSLSTNGIQATLCALLEYLGIKHFDIDIDRDLNSIYNQIDYNEKQNSFGYAHPSLVSEWHPNKNGKLTPFMVDKNSSKQVYWICSKGHEWKTHVYTRSKGIGCPYCSGRNATAENNLLVANPQLCDEWDYDRNTKMPNEYTPVSGQKVWWICGKCGNSFQQRIADKRIGKGCPICSSKLVIEGINDLTTSNPDLVEEWNYTKNPNLNPTQVTKGSNRKVWWTCSQCQHEWQATIINRVKGTGCPICRKKKL